MEDDGRAALVMRLSQLSSIEFAVTINAADKTATGMYRLHCSYIA